MHAFAAGAHRTQTFYGYAGNLPLVCVVLHEQQSRVFFVHVLEQKFRLG